jgi:phospholipase/carboxylesterase
MPAPLDGPRAGAAQPRHLVVLLHGFGADGRDLISLARQWTALLPHAAFVAPNAPEPCAGAPGGRQWFPLTMRDPNERWTGCVKAAPGLDAFLDAELARHGLDDSRLALVGFSQGTMMALHAGLRRSRPPAAIVGFSGLLVSGERLGGDRPAGAAAPPVLLTHGTEDDIIPVEALFMSADGLAEAGVPCQWHMAAGVGHGIDEGALSHAGQFLAASLGQAAARPPVA